MGFGFNLDTAAKIGSPAYLAYSLLNKKGGGQQGYAPIPYDTGANRAVDTGRLSQALQQGLGRAPTQNEIAQYSKYIKDGDLEYGDVTQIAQGLPEADRARLDQYAAQFSGALNAQNQDIINMAGAQVNSRFASLGRANTSAQGAAVMQAGGQLAQQRQSALANFYGQGLQNNMGAFRDQGQSSMNRAYNLTDSRTAYNRGLNGYQTQRSDYATDLENQEAKNKQRALYQLGGSLVGAGIGSVGGAPGAALGARIGGQAGGLF